MVTLPPPYDRRCPHCESIGGHASWCEDAPLTRDDEQIPVLAYLSDDADWVVSKGWMWFPGIYDSRDTAEYGAVRFTDEKIEELWSRLPEPRPITLADLDLLDRVEQARALRPELNDAELAEWLRSLAEYIRKHRED